MKNRYKILIGLLLVSGLAFASGVTQKWGTDTLQFGNSGSTDSKRFIVDTGDGSNNPTITIDMTDKDFDFNKALNIVANQVKLGDSNDGVAFKKIGSGGGGGGGVNLLAELNFDFEAGLVEWTNTGGTFVLEETTPMFGEGSAVWTVQAPGNTLATALVPLPDGILGRTCSVAFDYKYTSGDIRLNILDQTATVIHENINVPTSDGSRTFQYYFTCPTAPGTSLQARLDGFTISSPFSIDNGFIGTGLNSGGSFALKTETKFLSANITTPTNPVTDLTFNNLVVGRKYRVNLYFDTRATSNEPTNIALVGTNGPNVVCKVGYTIRQAGGTLDEGALRTSCSRSFVAAATTLTFEATGDLAANNVINGDGTSLETNVQLEEVISGEAITIYTSGALLTANHDNTCGFAKSGATFGPYSSDATCGFNITKNIGFKNVSSLETGGDKLPGLVLDFPFAGDWKICANPKAVSPTARIDLRLNVSGVQVASTYSSFSSGSTFAGDMCGVVGLSSTSGIELEIEGATSGGTTTLAKAFGDPSGNTIEWIITPVNQSVPMPVFSDGQAQLNSRISTGANNIKVCAGKVQYSGGTPFVANDTSCVDSLSDLGVGVTLITFNPGYFSTWASCRFGVVDINNGDNANCLTGVSGSNPTDVRAVCESSSAGTNTDFGFDFHCIGL